MQEYGDAVNLRALALFLRLFLCQVGDFCLGILPFLVTACCGAQQGATVGTAAGLSVNSASLSRMPRIAAARRTATLARRAAEERQVAAFCAKTAAAALPSSAPPAATRLAAVLTRVRAREAASCLAFGTSVAVNQLCLAECRGSPVKEG